MLSKKKSTRVCEKNFSINAKKILKGGKTKFKKNHRGIRKKMLGKVTHFEVLVA